MGVGGIGGNSGPYFSGGFPAAKGLIQAGRQKIDSATKGLLQSPASVSSEKLSEKKRES
jgi:hypothetical protein